MPRAALFVPPRFVPNDGLLTGLGCQVDEQGWVVVGQYGATSVPGVWVAGNVANPRAQVITAAGEGSAAAIAINADLVEEDVRDAVHDFNQGLCPDPTLLAPQWGPARTRHAQLHQSPHPPALAPDQGAPMSTPDPTPRPATAPVRPGPPTKHQLAVMIWLCVFPTLTLINLALGDWLRPMPAVLRTFVLATIAVPIVIYGLMPQLHKARVRLRAAAVRG